MTLFEPFEASQIQFTGIRVLLPQFNGLCQEIIVCLVDIVNSLGVGMVEVVEYAPVVWRINVEEWVGWECLVSTRIPPHLCVGELTCCMVEHNVDNYGDVTLVTLVDKALVCLLRTVSLVGSEEEAWIVTPRVVTVEFLDRHKLDGVHTQSLEVVELSSNGIDRALLGKVADEQLINCQLLTFWIANQKMC